MGNKKIESNLSADSSEVADEFECASQSRLLFEIYEGGSFEQY